MIDQESFSGWTRNEPTLGLDWEISLLVCGLAGEGGAGFGVGKSHFILVNSASM